jgi:hypothetical protein
MTNDTPNCCSTERAKNATARQDRSADRPDTCANCRILTLA